MPLRAVIYARFSSEHQRDASIGDQQRVCRELAAREGWEVVGSHEDRAISGATTQRPGYQALLAAARAGEFDVVVAEALDRLSRDQEDVAALFKRLRFAGIRIFTRAEGEISELHVGLKGTMNALFLKDLALKTHRGLRGRVEAGKSAGGLSFGYRAVRALDAQGELIRGDRRIDTAEAAIVRRIFAMFADGTSPMAIAQALNAERVPGPGGRAWLDTTIRGHAARGTGILRNELYVGRLVWNRMRFIKDPATGKRVSRVNPAEAWVSEAVPALRLIDDALWERAQRRLGAIRAASGADSWDKSRLWQHRRSQHLLTGKLFCGGCGGSFAAIGQDYLACNAARRQGTCANRQGVRRGELEALILDALRTRLMQPEHVAAFVAEFTTEWNRLQAEESALAGTRQRELEAVRRKLAGLIDALADGFRAPGLQQTLDELEARRAALEHAQQEAPASMPALHPNLAEIYRERVARLHEALQAGTEGTATLDAARALIERVVLHPASGGGLEIEVIGAIASMLDLAMGREGVGAAAPDRALFLRSAKVVAGTCNQFYLLFAVQGLRPIAAGSQA